jgi:PRTRC genetic system protein A
MFPVFVNDGTQELPDEDIMYIVCKEGTYLKKKLGIMESITPVKGISVLQSVEMMATMHIKPIPGTLFSQVIKFFNAVYNEYGGEAIVLLFYNEEKRVYKIVPPSQEVSVAGIDYNRAITMEGYIMIGDIHSHANFSAFHSGTDDADEKSFDGLHITIGNNSDEEVSLSASIVSNGQRFIVQPEDYINGITLTVDIDEEVEKKYATVHVWDVTLKKLVPKESNKTYKVRRYDKRYVSSVSEKYQRFPQEWMKLVTKKAYTYLGSISAAGWGYGSWRKWDNDKFDRDAWKNHKPYNQHNTQGAPQAKPPLVPPTTKPITFPPHPQEGPYEEVLEKDFNPCEACPFKEHKIDWVMEQITEREAAEELDDVEWFRCVQCESIIYSTDEAPICPTCDTDDHLVMLDEDEVAVLGKKESWYQCDQCEKTFDSEEDFPQCPVCQTDKFLTETDFQNNINPDQEIFYHFKCKECATETNVLNHGKCAFCGGEVMDQIDAEALRAANEADETLETLPIPVPDQDRIPLATTKKNKKRRKPGMFASLFQGRNKKI